jgi:hypothetical protein
MMGARGRAIVHEHLQKVVAEQIADEVRKHIERRRWAAGQAPPDLLVRYVASTFILVLDWWVESRNPMPPKEVNALFHTLVQPRGGPSLIKEATEKSGFQGPDAIDPSGLTVVR